MRILFSVVAVAALAAPIQIVKAQIVAGVVIDAQTGNRLADASVTLLDRDGKILAGRLTEPDGTFLLPCPKDGRYIVRAGGMGYITWDSDEIKIGKDETYELQIRLQPERAGSGGIAAFEQRRAKGDGVFLTEDEIRDRGGSRFTDVFLNLPGVLVVPMEMDTRVTSAYERERSGTDIGGRTVRLAGAHTGADAAGARQNLETREGCPPLLYVNGAWWGRLDSVSETGPDYEILPDEMVGIEIYTPTLVPPEFDTGRDSACGVIVVWTSDGRTRR